MEGGDKEMEHIQIFYEASLNDPPDERLSFHEAIDRAQKALRSWEIKNNRKGLIIELHLTPHGLWIVRWQ